MAPAVLKLRQLWINDAADPADYVVVPMLRDSMRTPKVRGEARENAAGRVRLVRRAGRTEAWAPQLGVVPLDVALDLKDRCGRLQTFRDGVGGKLHGVFWEAPYVLLGRMNGVQSARVTLAITEITHSEEV